MIARTHGLSNSTCATATCGTWRAGLRLRNRNFEDEWKKLEKPPITAADAWDLGVQATQAHLLEEAGWKGAKVPQNGPPRPARGGEGTSRSELDIYDEPQDRTGPFETRSDASSRDSSASPQTPTASRQPTS